MPIAEIATETCSKCSGGLDTSGYPKWCKACRATYQREYDSLRQGMKEKHGFAAGVTAMRQVLAVEFDKHGFGQFSGVEIRDLILQAPGPKLPD